MAHRSSAEIRNAFLRFFEQRGHRRVASSPLIPGDDPTLLFTNAGMNQFKDVFTGAKPATYTRAVTAQKCVRAGGKHNDLENVGVTARHHTFFEMLGNFSFGDYFKADACRFAWDFAVGELGIDAERLYITIFENDDEAYGIWRDIGVRDDRIVRMGAKSNFWSMGDVGPCGPCSELLVDQGEGPGGVWKNETIYGDSDRFLEIWNLVFMQFEQHADGSRTPLPKPCIDTGAGLERLTAIANRVFSNYDTDLFRPIVELAGRLAGKTYGADPADDVSMRVIADHTRAAVFLIADGVVPSNEGRGYVLRRIMRRAVRHARRLGIADPFYAGTAGAVVDHMKDAYPELAARKDAIERWVSSEETGFRRTLDRGLALLDREVEAAKAAGAGAVGGDAAFTLYDTYGFPLDLTQIIAGEAGLGVDEAGFSAHMEAQRERSRASWKTGDHALDELFRKVQADTAPTRFTGYEHTRGTGRVTALVAEVKTGDAVAYRRSERLEPGESGWAFFDETPFYAESGGQVGDKGVLLGTDGAPAADVTDTTKPLPDLFAHRVTVGPGAGLAVGERYGQRIGEAERAAARLNHSATHLLHHALREVLGDHVRQAGSFVGPGYLRFDFNHFEAVGDEALAAIERRVNELVRADAPVATVETTPEAAANDGALMFFGEKYGAVVRMVRMGPSLELCGGTHVARTGEIGLLRITSEGAVAKGVRRMEAVTGAAAMAFTQARDQALRAATGALNAGVDEVGDRAAALVDQLRGAEKEIVRLRRALLMLESDAALKSVNEWGNVRALVAALPEMAGADLRELALKRAGEIGPAAIVVLAAPTPDGKAGLAVAVGRGLVAAGWSAGNWVKDLAPLIAGKGGGKPDAAQAGGTAPEKIPHLTAVARERIEQTARNDGVTSPAEQTLSR